MSRDYASAREPADILLGGREDERAVEALAAPAREVSSLVDALRRRTDVAYDETTQRHLDAIARAAARLGHLCDDLRALARLDHAELQPARVSLSRLVRELLVELRATGDVEWQVDDLPEVLADPALLRTALSHLLGNALKYTRMRERPRIEVGTLPRDGAAVVVYVRDNGAGFDMADAEKLFGAFARLHPDRDYEGRGVGLATVRRIVERHGGRAWAHGTAGQGATFFFSLPVPQEEA